MLFLAINFLIVATVSILLNLFHVAPYLNRYGLDYQSLALFCLIWGISGAVISLLISKQMAKWMMGVRIVNYNTNDHESKMLLEMVTTLSQRAGLQNVPEVGIFESHQPNAFATGPSKRRSLVAVSRGLLNQLSKDEIEAVIGHEIAHIANGDMVTMTLIQGVVNAFVMFLARIIAYAISGLGNRDENGRSKGSYLSYYLFTSLFEIVFMIAGSMVISYFSRRREFRADKGSRDLLGAEPMINALRKLQRIEGKSELSSDQRSVAALMINRPSKQSGILNFFATHPPIEARIARLQESI